MSDTSYTGHEVSNPVHHMIIEGNLLSCPTYSMYTQVFFRFLPDTKLKTLEKTKLVLGGNEVKLVKESMIAINPVYV